MRISAAEQQAIKQVVAAGDQFGYGNMISHLATAWAKMLMTKWSLPEASARAAAYGLSGYPFRMQEDLMERGQWDETGAAYSGEPKQA